MSSFMHKSCQSIIYIDSSNTIMLLSENVSINTRNVKAAGLFVIKDKGANGNLTFFCPECNKVVPLSEVTIPCSHCGTSIGLDKALKIVDTGGIYCPEHVKQNNPEGRTVFNIIDVFKRNFKGEK
jgi:hypothetical protein